MQKTPPRLSPVAGILGTKYEQPKVIKKYYCKNIGLGEIIVEIKKPRLRGLVGCELFCCPD